MRKVGGLARCICCGQQEGKPSTAAAAAGAEPQSSASLQPRQQSRVPSLALAQPVAQAEPDELRDPDTVFDLCNADKGGSLDKFELRFALNAFGLYPNMTTIEGDMSGKDALNKAEFRALLERLMAKTPPSELQPRAVPYARRGVSMGQLEDLNRTFVDSGWLQQRIDSFNKQNAAEIASKKVFRLEVNLYALDKFVIRPVTLPADGAGILDFGGETARVEVTAQEAFDSYKRKLSRLDEFESEGVSRRMREDANLPDATHKCSYSELVNPKGIRVHFFVSHFWGHEFQDTMRALRLWSQRSHVKCGQEAPEGVVFWLCFLALNQHRVQEEVGATPEQGPFNAALAEAPSGIMVLDPNVEPFSRIWCLYEVFRFQTLQKDLDLVSGLGLVSELEDGQGKSEEKLAYMQRVGDALKELSAANSNSSSLEDQRAIWHRIMEKRYHNIKLDQVLARTRNSGFTENHFKTFDAKIRGMLAEPLFRASLSAKDLGGALRWMSLGARFGKEELEKLQAMRCDVCKQVVKVQRGRAAIATWTLMHCAAFYGNEEGLVALLERRAEPGPSTNFGRTPLHFASTNHHLGVIDILLANQADIEQTEQTGCTAMHIAALDGQTEVVKKLVEHRGEVNHTSAKNGDTPLLKAATYGFQNVVDLLLRAGADPCPARVRQWPIHTAAEHGHLAVIDQLLAARSEVDANAGAGETPLHRAAYAGQVDAAKKLIELRADVHAQEDKFHESAMQKAAFSGCVEMVQLLIQNGVSVNAKHPKTSSPLAVAMKESKKDMVKALLGARASLEDVGSSDGSAIHVAASSGDVDVIRSVLKFRADIEERSTKWGVSFTPIYFACLGNHDQAMTALLEAKADVNARTSTGTTLVHSSAYSGSPAGARVALASGLSVNAAEPETGNTPLHIAIDRLHAMAAAFQEAAEATEGKGKDKGKGKGKGKDKKKSTEKINQYIEVAKVLKESGADLKIANAWGETIHDLVNKTSGRELEELRKIFPAPRAGKGGGRRR